MSLNNTNTCFNIIRSIFGLLFCLRDRSLTLRSKTINQSMSNFPCAAWYVGTLPQMEKRRINIFFPENCTLVCVLKLFLNNHPFSYPQNLVTNFSERKYYRLLLCATEWRYKHPLTLNYPLQYAKRLSNIIAR